MDITKISAAREALDEFFRIDPANAGVPEYREHFSKDVDDVVSGSIAAIKKEWGGDLSALPRSDKVKAVSYTHLLHQPLHGFGLREVDHPRAGIHPDVHAPRLLAGADTGRLQNRRLDDEHHHAADVLLRDDHRLCEGIRRKLRHRHADLEMCIRDSYKGGLAGKRRIGLHLVAGAVVELAAF